MNKNITELKTFFDQLNIISEETLSSDDNDDNDNSFSINCKYYDTDDFCAQFNKSKCFSAFHLNIASLTKHFDELQNLLCTLDTTFSIIAITETKFSRNILPFVNYSLPHYSIEHTPTDSSAGGALLYISNHLAYKPRNDLTKKLYKAKELESIFIELIYKRKKNIVIGCIYKHPPMSIEEFNKYFLLPILDKINKEKKTILLLGDFNIDLLKSNIDNNISYFLDIMGSYDLLPQILLPTRITDNSQTLIDNIFLDSSTFLPISGNLTYHISDHLPQVLLLKNTKIDNVKENIYKRNWKKFDQENFIMDFLAVNWDDILKTKEGNTDLSFDIFYSKINELLNKYVPITKLNKKQIKNMSKPWITSGIKKSICIRNQLNKKIIRGTNPRTKTIIENQYKKYRNLITKLCRQSKKKLLFFVFSKKF